MPDIYFDHVATTCPHEEVLEAMIPFMREHFANPSSMHQAGQLANQAIETARDEVAGLIGAKSSEILFTASGSESNNLAIKGAAWVNRK